MRLSAKVTVEPARRVHGRLRVPGDKSISHRYALLAALARGRTELSNYAPGADCQSTLECIRRLGVDAAAGADGVLTIVGRGPLGLSSPSNVLDCGNSGTTMRLLTGVVAAHPFSARLAGDSSLSARPMRRIVSPLERMGARIETSDGRAPLVVHGATLHGIATRTEVPSAQVKSAILLAGLLADGTTTVEEAAQTRDHTERAIDAFGGATRASGLSVAIQGGQPLHGQRLAVPGDFSSAVFWMIAAAALPGSAIEIHDVGLNPTRTALLGVLERFGARVDVAVTHVAAGEPRGTIAVTADVVRPLAIAPDEVPGLIDELPALAALGALAGEVTVRGASELRVKESDRISALVAGFRALGVEADEFPDGFAVRSSPGADLRPSGGVADAMGDHRLAMAFGIAALGATRPSTIVGADAVAISYPGYFDALSQVVAA
jgi:3-phosphoshikimate 1-carboxyvinyltransferase